MKKLIAEEGKIFQSLIDSSIYATTIYLADNDDESNYKLIDESEVVMPNNIEDIPEIYEDVLMKDNKIIDYSEF